MHIFSLFICTCPSPHRAHEKRLLSELVFNYLPYKKIRYAQDAIVLEIRAG